MANANPNDIYFGSYIRFETVDKKAGAALVGPDNAIGDIGDIVWKRDANHQQQAWLQNRFGGQFGFIDPKESHKLAVIHAKGWTIKYVLSFTAYSEKPDPGVYWGQVAIIAYPKRYEESFSVFLKTFSEACATGARPDPELGPSSIQTILDDASSWKSTKKVKIPSLDSSSVVLKDHRSVHDKVLDMSRKKNVGCYIISWIFLLGLVAAIVYAAHSFGIF